MEANDTSQSAPPPASISTEQKLIKVTLKQDHTHADQKYKAGDTIEVNEADAKWLRDNKVI